MSNEAFKIVICHLSFVIQAKTFDKSFKGRKVCINNAPKKHLRGNSHLFAYLRFCAFTRVSLYRFFSAFSAF